MGNGNGNGKKWREFGLLAMAFSLLRLAFISATMGRNGTDRDRLALLSFKSEITQDPFGLLGSWNESVHVCDWKGVRCGRRNRRRRVILLDLHSYRLVGRLPPSVGNLSFLMSLDLHNNSFTGKIPPEIGRLFRLQLMNFENNLFVGEIPISISNCSELQYVELGSNNLTGILPSELGLLPKLQELKLSSNQLFGEMPASIGNLSSLRIFSAPRNNLNGRIPKTFGRLKNLTVLSLGVNELKGTIPSSIYNLSSIEIFSVPVNQLQGSLPTDIGLIFPNLKILRFHTNRFSGMIPSTMSNASKLVEFSIGRNMFTGKVPSLASMRDLEDVGINNNNLGFGDVSDLNFMSSLVNCTNLSSLVISDNHFGGLLPAYISNFSTRLSIMGFGRNYIHGTIPTEIGNLVGLEALGLETNQLTGSIPSSLGKLTNLNALYINGNKLSGKIPRSLGNLSALEDFNLGANNFVGAIPPSLGECKNLVILVLYQNNLTGTLPKELLNISSLSIALDLSENYLTGSIPSEVSKLVNLGYLNFSENKLTGVIPSTLSGCTSLETLHLYGNFLQGSIPQSLSSLRGIEDIDLSRNNLSGPIPTYLQEFAFLGNLNLSFNNLEGEVPIHGVFKNATAFSIIGNKQLCGGIPELDLPSCSLNNPKKRKSNITLKIIISVTGGVVGLILILCFLLRRRSRKIRNKPNTSLSPRVPYFRVSYNDLLKATNEFSSANLVGVGSYGSVYKGTLSQDGSVVAVKVFNLQHRGASRSFLAECEALRNIRHRNLVKICAACSSVDFQGNDFMALVYEFMVNESLEKWLHPIDILNQAEGERYLNVIQRLNIAIDVASALDYLHNESPVPIAHCDLKPSNVLLDVDMTAHVGDFGLAKFIAGASFQNSSTETGSIGVRGSIGYAPPEYAMGSEVSTHGDVYSYGILLLEIFTGKRPTDEMFKDGLNLNNYVQMALPERVKQIADPSMIHREAEETGNINTRSWTRRSDRIQECLLTIFRIGIECSSQITSQRMNIGNVVRQLCVARHTFLMDG